MNKITNDNGQLESWICKGYLASGYGFVFRVIGEKRLCSKNFSSYLRNIFM